MCERFCCYILFLTSPPAHHYQSTCPAGPHRSTKVRIPPFQLFPIFLVAILCLFIIHNIQCSFIIAYGSYSGWPLLQYGDYPGSRIPLIFGILTKKWKVVHPLQYHLSSAFLQCSPENRKSEWFKKMDKEGIQLRSCTFLQELFRIICCNTA